MGILTVSEDTRRDSVFPHDVMDVAVIPDEIVDLQDIPNDLATQFGLLYALNIDYPKEL